MNGTILSGKKNVGVCIAHIELHYWPGGGSVLQEERRRNTVSASRSLQDGRFIRDYRKTKSIDLQQCVFVKAGSVNSAAGRATVHRIRRSPLSAETRVLCQRLWWKPYRPLSDLFRRTREACVRFVVKNQRDLCEVCGEEPERPVWGLWWRIREACVRFVVKNQRGLCEVCGEESERPVWGLWWRIREACVRFVVKKQRGLCEVCGEETERPVWDLF